MRRLVATAAVLAAAAVAVPVVGAGDRPSTKPAPPTRVVPLLRLKATPPAILIPRRHDNHSRSGLAGWVRHEGKWFVWYAPGAGWHDVQSVGGIDLASADGTRGVSFGFSGWPTPLTFDDVVNYWRKTMTAGVVRRIRIDPAGPVTQQGAIFKRIFDWSGFRTDLRQNVRGVLTVHVYRDETQQIFGFDAYTRIGPAAGYDRLDPTLQRVQSLIIYKPHEPPCIRHDPACEPKKKK